MRIRWRGLELPSQLERDESVSTETYGKFTVEPFERGFGTTVGNALRRILLSSLEGSAVYTVKLAQAPHEFTTIPGVVEDVADIILNIKSLVVDMEGDESRLITLSANKAGELTAAQIECPTGVEIMNKDLKIATLSEDVPFDMELRVKKGRGYITADENTGPEQEVGVIPVDSIFSPVTRVRYKTEDTRVGQRTNYDRLILEVWTRGSITPEDAVVEAGKILRKHLNPFVQYYELGDDLVTEAVPMRTASADVDDAMQEALERSVADLQLSVRAGNCLESARIRTIGELVAKTEADLLRVRSFGKTSLREIKRKLADLGLSLGITFSDASAVSVPLEYAGSDDLSGGADDASLPGSDSLPGGEPLPRDDSSPESQGPESQGGGGGSVSVIADSTGGEHS